MATELPYDLTPELAPLSWLIGSWEGQGRLGDGSGGQWVSANRARSESLLRGLRDAIDEHPTPTVLLVLDSDVLTEGRDAPARRLLGHGRAERLGAVVQHRHDVDAVRVQLAREPVPEPRLAVCDDGPWAAARDPGAASGLGCLPPPA